VASFTFVMSPTPKMSNSNFFATTKFKKWKLTRLVKFKFLILLKI